MAGSFSVSENSLWVLTFLTLFTVLGHPFFLVNVLFLLISLGSKLKEHGKPLSSPHFAFSIRLVMTLIFWNATIFPLFSSNLWHLIKMSYLLSVWSGKFHMLYVVAKKIYLFAVAIVGLPPWLRRIPLLMQETGVWSWVGEMPWRRKWQPTPVFSLEEFHGWRSLMGSWWVQGVAKRHDWESFSLPSGIQQGQGLPSLLRTRPST